MRNQPLFIGLLIVVCIVQQCRINGLRGDVKMYQKGLDAALDLNEEKRTKLQDCEDDNYAVHAKVDYVQGQNEYMLDRCTAIWNRLKKTTDVLESTARCAYFRLEPSHCGIDEKKLGTLMYENRKANF